jgi:hypothetical protein
LTAETTTPDPRYSCKVLRERLVTSTSPALVNQEDVLAVPYDTRDEAVDEVVEAYRA